MSQQAKNVVPLVWQQCVDIFLVILTVTFSKLSFPGGDYPLLAWCTFLPLGLAIHGKKSRYVFILSTSCALLAWLCAVWWVVRGVAQIAGSNGLVIAPFLLVFCLFYALPYGLSAMLYGYFGWTSNICGAFKGALLWTTIVCLVPHILPGNISHSQYQVPQIIQVVEIGGIPVLLFLMNLCNFLLITAAVNLRSNLRISVSSVVLAITIPACMFGYGNLRIDELRRSIDKSDLNSINVGIVQPNISIHSRGRNSWYQESSRLTSMTYDLARNNPTLDIIVWPEIPPPISYAQNVDDKVLIDKLLEDTGLPLIIAGLKNESAENPDDPEGYYNVAEYISSSVEYTSYRKQILVPFGEYLPKENRFPWLRKLFPNAPHYLPGTSSKLFDSIGNIQFLPLICYEAIFPDLVRKGVLLGGNAIVNPVDDAWFGKSKGPEIHLALAIFRAVEYRVPIVRASNSGRSVLVNITGETVSSSTGLFVEENISGTINVMPIATPYAQYGNYIVWVLSILTMLILIQEFKKRSRGDVSVKKKPD